MNQFLESYTLLRLNQEEIENLNRQIESEKIEPVIKNLAKNKKTQIHKCLLMSSQIFKDYILKFSTILIKHDNPS